MSDHGQTLDLTGFAAPHQTPQFSLVDEGWIPVLSADGPLQHVGIEQLLCSGHQYALAAADPAQSEALHRFLIALTNMVDAHTPGGANWTAIANGDPLPPDAITTVCDRIRPYMNLYDPHHPAFQDLRIVSTVPHKTRPEPDKTETWQDAASGPGLLIADLPVKSETVWVVDEAVRTRILTDAQLALALVTHHYVTSSGNVTANSTAKHGQVPGAAAGVNSAFTQTFVHNEADTFAQTAAANILADWQDNITVDSVPYWEDPDGDLRRHNDLLWGYTATCVATLIGVDRDGQTAAVRTAPLISKEQLAQRRERIWRNDPHLLRTTIAGRDGTPKTKNGQLELQLVRVAPDRSTYQWLRDLQAAIGPGGTRLHAPSILAPHATAVPPSDTVRLVATTIGFRGSSLSRPISYVERIELDPHQFRPIGNPDRHDALCVLLEQVGGAEKSVRSTLRYAVRVALDLRQAPDGLDRTFYQHLDPVLDPAVRHVLNDPAPNPDTPADDNLNLRVLNAAITTYDNVCRPYDTDAHFAARIYKSRRYLRGKLWTLLNLPTKTNSTTATG